MDIFTKCYQHSFVDELRERDLFPYFRELQSRQDTEVIMEGKRRIMLGSNNYLGLTTNPEIIAAEGEQTGLEGCLSIPGKFGIVTRPYTVRVRAQDRDGNFFEVEDEELTARCFCHEIEHLDGHLFVEHTDHLMTEEELEEYMNRQEEDEE